MAWPPATAPSWPPPVYERAEAYDLDGLLGSLESDGWTQVAPTGPERNAFFNSATCEEGHNVVGRMLVSSDGTRYPFAICNNAANRKVLVLWAPFEWSID